MTRLSHQDHSCLISYWGSHDPGGRVERAWALAFRGPSPDPDLTTPQPFPQEHNVSEPELDCQCNGDSYPGSPRIVIKENHNTRAQECASCSPFLLFLRTPLAAPSRSRRLALQAAHPVPPWHPWCFVLSGAVLVLLSKCPPPPCPCG